MPMIRLIDPDQSVAAFALDGTRITVSGLTIDCAAEQKDTEATIEVRDNAGSIERGGDGAYIAIIVIPAREYIDQQGDIDPETNEPRIERVPVPLDANAIAITLWPTSA